MVDSGLRGRGARSRIAPLELIDRLAKTYGEPKWSPRFGATEELVFTVLTQHTSDSNAGIAYRALIERYPTWREVVAADTEELADTIRRGGLANQKAPRIQAMLAEIKRQRGTYDLDFLASHPLVSAKEWLSALPGVGPKTAAVVLAFSLGLPAMPVDTHIYRVGRRLGLIPLHVNVETAHKLMEAQVPPEMVYRYHVLLITHGRRICKAQRPLCGECPLASLCPARPKFEKAFAKDRYQRPRAGTQRL